MIRENYFFTSPFDWSSKPQQSSFLRRRVRLLPTMLPCPSGRSGGWRGVWSSILYILSYSKREYSVQLTHNSSDILVSKEYLSIPVSAQTPRTEHKHHPPLSTSSIESVRCWRSLNVSKQKGPEFNVQTRLTSNQKSQVICTVTAISPDTIDKR